MHKSHAPYRSTFLFINTFENLILTGVTILVMIMCLEALEDCTFTWLTTEGMAQSVYMDTTSCSAVGFDHLVESQEGLETKVGPMTDLVGAPGESSCLVIERSYGVWLVLTTRCQNWVPMTSLPSCARNPHVGSSISIIKILKKKMFSYNLHELFL
ncbi:hypothetical protein M9H77_04025 [Catharanthus roseus]|uniref:Uncharacterized protein n=1 Tax=Catharanthus roseus TaxID=4058 RepID=A0ACC0CD76_CATRO|nr:hypothetical protein M9H77_04025 [Catharanthus roseus]